MFYKKPSENYHVCTKGLWGISTIFSIVAYIVINLFENKWVILVWTIVPLALSLYAVFTSVLYYSKYKFYEKEILSVNGETFYYDNIKAIHVVKPKMGVRNRCKYIFFEFKDNQKMCWLIIPNNYDGFMQSLKKKCPNIDFIDKGEIVEKKGQDLRLLE